MIGIGAVYAAANVYSLDERLLEAPRPARPGRQALPRGVFLAAALATALLPLVVLAWGFGSRRTFVLDTGIVLLALSLVTLRHYVHVAPLWVVLTLSGALLILLALAVERALRRAPAGEVAGFTADPLFSDERRQQALQLVPVVTALTPPAAAPTHDPGFTAEGGAIRGRRRSGEVLMRRCRRHRVAMVRWGSGALPTPAVFGNPSATLTETGGAHTVAAAFAAGGLLSAPGRTPVQEEPRQFPQRLVRRLLGQEVTARERAPAHVGCPPLPGLEHLPTPAALAPQGEHRALDAPAGGESASSRSKSIVAPAR